MGASHYGSAIVAGAHYYYCIKINEYTLKLFDPLYTGDSIMSSLANLKDPIMRHIIRIYTVC